MKLDKWQQDFLNAKGDKILCTGRQVGKSVVCSIDAAKYAISNPNSKPIVMIAPTERQAFALFDKTLQYLLDKYPRAVVTKGLKRPTKTRILLRSGVEIYCLPVGSSGLGIRFLTIGRLYVDEASRMPEEVWAAITPALLTTGGDTILLSTPFGAQGEFYRVWINSDDAYNSFSRFSVDSEQVMRDRPISLSWSELQRDRSLMVLERAKKRMSKHQYAQEYLGEFVEDLHRWFSDELIAQTCTLKRPEVINKKFQYYLGCDIARMGEDEGTMEVIQKIDNDHLIHVENIVTRKQLTTETEERIINIDRHYDFVKIFIDAGAGSLGVSVFDHLLKIDQTKRKVVAINNARRRIDKDGHELKLMKTDLYDNLRALMEQNKIKLLDDEDVRDSLRSIQYEYIMKEGELSTLRIFGNYSHIVEGLIRAAWCVQYKDINIWIDTIKV